jgi:hypothetical protein
VAAHAEVSPSDAPDEPGGSTISRRTPVVSWSKVSRRSRSSSTTRASVEPSTSSIVK